MSEKINKHNSQYRRYRKTSSEQETPKTDKGSKNSRKRSNLDFLWDRDFRSCSIISTWRLDRNTKCWRTERAVWTPASTSYWDPSKGWNRRIHRGFGRLHITPSKVLQGASIVRGNALEQTQECSSSRLLCRQHGLLQFELLGHVHRSGRERQAGTLSLLPMVRE